MTFVCNGIHVAESVIYQAVAKKRVLEHKINALKAHKRMAAKRASEGSAGEVCLVKTVEAGWPLALL